MATAVRTRGDLIWSVLMTALGIACFPANPLVLTGIIEVESSLPLVVIGGVVWAWGKIMIMAGSAAPIDVYSHFN